jgi:hypothetical protein
MYWSFFEGIAVDCRLASQNGDNVSVEQAEYVVPGVSPSVFQLVGIVHSPQTDTVTNSVRE